MATIYCRDRHGSPSGLCPECAALMTYAAKRLAVCPFGEDKPVCAKCKVHCYGPAPREQVRTIMRCAGPRMMLQHPWLALGHVLVLNPATLIEALVTVPSTATVRSW